MERRGSRGVTSRRVATKSPPRNKSPTRNKSPARKSPARKSPARKIEPIKEEPATKARRGRPKAAPSQPKSESPKNELRKASLSPIKHETGRSSVHTKSVTTTTSSSVKVSQISNESDDEVKRLISRRLNAAREKLDGLRYTPTPSELSRQSRQSQSRSMSRSVLDDDDEYSDRETEPIHDEDRNKYSYRLETKRPTTSLWVGLSVLVLILLISAVGFYLPFSCNREECDFSVARLAKLKWLKTYGNWDVSIYYPAYIFAIYLLSAIPIGRTIPLKNESPSISYNFNGLALSVIVGAAVAIAEYLKYPVIRFIYGNYQQFCCAAIAYALIVAGWRYVMNRNVHNEYTWNPYAKSGSFWKDYFVGREINPRWLLFDIKLIHYHAAIIATLLLNGIFIYRNLKFSALPTENGNITLNWTEAILFTYNNVKYDPIALLTACLVFWHALDQLIFEHHLASSFFLQGEGVGAFLLLRNALYPFLNSLIAKYAWEHKIVGVPGWAIFVTVAVFTIGWFIKRGSCKIKYEFRMDPTNPKFYHADTIQTLQHRRLLVSAYWGLIRQPNYLGEIISYLALAIPLIWGFAWPPLVAILISVVHLILRGKQMSHRNFNRYNSHWARYCQRVKYILIPKVF
ncbi:lamin-B receptor [Bradysia coprophila]|uniref:lamin-B receptor n=1 Tax=Bradysia coprophila TaxID=38358 RepID=UPI00187DA593|nr:lamin-B receptor [Bradysia coprophila]